MATASEVKELSGVLDQLVENTEGDKITLGDLLDALDSRSYGPLLLIIGLIAISPIGAVPGMSIVTGTLIVLLCGQMLLGFAHPWFPKFLLSIKFGRKRLTKSVDRGRPWIEWFEKALHHRLAFLVEGPALAGVAIISIFLAITFYPLALIPMGVFLPGAAITLLAVGVTARDGLLVLLGYVMTAVAIGVLIAFWPF